MKKSGVPNYLGLRIQLPSNFNFKYLEKHLLGHSDTLLIDFLRFGFPVDHSGNTGSKVVPHNHAGATEFPQQMRKLLRKEVEFGSTLGPFSEPILPNSYFSPLNTVSKKQTTERRLILDLSFPPGNSINDGIEKDCYQGKWEKLELPSIDKLVERIVELGKGCKIFKIDLRRSYRQFFIDPNDFNLICFSFDDLFYYDCSLSMGSKSSARCCQKVTTVIVYIFTNKGYFAINYLDDLGGADSSARANIAYAMLRHILAEAGLQEAVDKSCPPSMCMTFLGIEVNTITFTLKIPDEKWQEILIVLSHWTNKSTASLKEVQQLAGLLNFACKCVCSGRIYLSRILNFLHSFSSEKVQMVPGSMLRDVQWWREFAPLYSGTSLMLENQWTSPDHLLCSDSCLTGRGAYIEGEYLQWDFDDRIKKCCVHINELECLVLVVAVKIWAHRFPCKKFVLHCDSMITVRAINLGSSRNKVIQNCLRELHTVIAYTNVDVKTKFYPGSQKRLADELSRWGRHCSHKIEALRSVANWKRIEVTLSDYDFVFRWFKFTLKPPIVVAIANL